MGNINQKQIVDHANNSNQDSKKQKLEQFISEVKGLVHANEPVGSLLLQEIKSIESIAINDEKSMNEAIDRIFVIKNSFKEAIKYKLINNKDLKELKKQANDIINTFGGIDNVARYINSQKVVKEYINSQKVVKTEKLFPHEFFKVDLLSLMLVREVLNITQDWIDKFSVSEENSMFHVKSGDQVIFHDTKLVYYKFYAYHLNLQESFYSGKELVRKNTSEIALIPSNMEKMIEALNDFASFAVKINLSEDKTTDVYKDLIAKLVKEEGGKIFSFKDKFMKLQDKEEGDKISSVKIPENNSCFVEESQFKDSLHLLFKHMLEKELLTKEQIIEADSDENWQSAVKKYIELELKNQSAAQGLIDKGALSDDGGNNQFKILYYQDDTNVNDGFMGEMFKDQ